MTSSDEVKRVQEVVANPAALGLLGLAIVTLVASSQKLYWTGGDAKSVALVLPWAIFLGAVAQFVAGIKEFKHNNIFGATAFLGYAVFWLGVSMTWMIQLGVFGEYAREVADPKQLGVAFIGYFIFSSYMTVGSTTTSKVLFAIFIFIDLLFIGLALNVIWDVEFGRLLAGWSELAIALLSFYGSAATVLNAHFDRVVLPVGKAFGPFAAKA